MKITRKEQQLAGGKHILFINGKKDLQCNPGGCSEAISQYFVYSFQVMSTPWRQEACDPRAADFHSPSTSLQRPVTEYHLVIESSGNLSSSFI